MRNMVMSVSYDGTAYCGFQAQPGGLDTIEGRLEHALQTLTGQPHTLQASGRTDAGVHARRQIVSFLTESRIPTERLSLAMNARLPDDIVVLEVWEAAPDFHARYSAKRKTYRYNIERAKVHNVFHRHTRFHHPRPLNVAAMNEAIRCLVGKHVFTSFCSVRTAVGSHVRTIYEASVWFEPEPVPGDGDAGVIRIEVTGNGFLYHMVRIIAGTLIEVGEGKRDPRDMAVILAAQNRSKAGPTAMAHGLTLWDVVY